MSQQGEKPAADEDDWWRKLYDDAARDTGPGSETDSLDDRFDSASDAVGAGGAGGGADHPVTVVPLPDPRLPEADPPPGKRPARHAAPRPDRAPDPPAAPQPPPEPPPAPPVPHRPPAGVDERAPWEAPVGPPRPRTFAAPPPPPVPPAVPGAPEPPARPVVGHVGDRPPTYDAEPASLPLSGPDDLDGTVPDTVLDGARYGTYTLRAASVRGDSARFRGEPRRDALLTARFGAGAGDAALVLVAVAGGTRGSDVAHLAAADACRWIGGAVARSHARLSDDIRAGRRGDLKSGLHRLTDRTYGKLRARAAELGLDPSAYSAGLGCLLLSADPDCRTRVFFGTGRGGLFRLRDGAWQDLDPVLPAPMGAVEEEGPGGDRLTMDLQITTPPSPYEESPPQEPAEPFHFRASVARTGDTLLLCGSGMAEPMRREPELAGELARRWASDAPPGLPAYLADIQLRTKGYADDRTCAAVWEA
ncbi:protein phosphatase 2C domain-containing protein [Streptomyces sp. NPDC057428]|uniref:protein phosphatase 2C domain-containing protein n=1 Tax=Streptomyces sp. NPDC057428 TaxID=3346129 RepID=UPI0036CBC61E